MRILLVDDDVDDTEVFAEALRVVAPSVEFQSAVNGKEALVLLLTNHTFDIIFLDYRMPVMDALQFLIELKALNIPAPPSVIMYSTYLNEHTKSECSELGAVSYIQKPGGFDGICKVIADAIANNSTNKK